MTDRTEDQDVEGLVERLNNELGWGIGPSLLCQQAAQAIRSLLSRLRKAEGELALRDPRPATWRGKCGHLWDRAVEGTEDCPRCASQSEAAALRVERDAMDRALQREREIWRTDPQMLRLDRVRQNIAGLRPGDAEAIAEFQAYGVRLMAEKEASEAREAALRERVGELEKRANDKGELEKLVRHIFYASPTEGASLNLAEAVRRYLLDLPQKTAEEAQQEFLASLSYEDRAEWHRQQNTAQLLKGQPQWLRWKNCRCSRCRSSRTATAST